MGMLFHQLWIATAIVSATIVIHLVGLDALQALVRWHLRRLARWITLDRLLVPLGIVLGLFVLHGVEIWLYALIYWRTGMLGTLEQALYFSTSAYSTVGETGALLPEAWRIVGVLEAINGMLLIGWSTAFLFQILQHLMWDDAESHSLPRGAIARRRRKGD
ncbi:hypothetical protein [Phenylobacterium sp.]|uniref:hypothetical protein n=1 Tax=Phenylobacterium sp. TaxID=1871053 RepID=UPI0035AE7977